MKKHLISTGITVILTCFSYVTAITQTGNTTYGNQAGASITTADSCTLTGEAAGQNITSGSYNTFIGALSGKELTTGSDNVYIGYLAGTSFTTSFDNTIIGTRAGRSFTNGANNNVFMGTEAGEFNTSGSDNVFIGEQSGQKNTTGSRNVFVGEDSGFSNDMGEDNTFVGRFAGYHNTNGICNVFIGGQSVGSDPYGSSTRAAGDDNTTGKYNTCVGAGAGGDSDIPDGNTMIGYAAGHNTEEVGQCTFVGAFSGWDNNRTNGVNEGINNTYMGYGSGATNRNGGNNVGIGTNADYTTSGSFAPVNNRTVFIGANSVMNGNDAVTVGYESTASSSQSISIGASASVTGNNSIAIGYQANVSGNNEVYFGNSAVASIGGIVNWTATSDARFKNNVKEDVPGLSFINRLRPVTYNFDARKLHNHKSGCTEELEHAFAEKENIRYTGFIAQEVEQAAQESHYDFSGVDIPSTSSDVYGLRYAEFSVPLVKAVQELDEKLIITDNGLSASSQRLNDVEQKLKSQQETINQLLEFIKVQQKQNLAQQESLNNLQNQLTEILGNNISKTNLKALAELNQK